MKVTTFRKVTITATWKGYGTYLFEADYRGKHIKVISHDSLAYDRMSCQCPQNYAAENGFTVKEAKELLSDAKLSAYWIIRREYERLYC